MAVAQVLVENAKLLNAQRPSGLSKTQKVVHKWRASPL